MFASSSTRRSSSLASSSRDTKNEMPLPVEVNNNNNYNHNKQTERFRSRSINKHRKYRRTSTNLVLIIKFVAFFMALVFVATGVLVYSKHNEHSNEIRATNIRGADPYAKRNVWVAEKSQPFNEDGLAVNADHLIMVAGHSVTVSGHLQDADVDEKDWFLLDYQKGQGLPQAIYAHIFTGIDEARKDTKSLLIFSGGETRSVSGPQTESQAYYHVADAMNLWPDNSSVRARTSTEEFATDSFENLLFSICRFREITGSYPKEITVVSFSFKRRRFEMLHAPALRWPEDRFRYVGVDPPESTGFDLQRSTEGESKNAAAPFEKDPYGCHSTVLQEKRKARNPFKRTPPYKLSCPEMKELLEFCGPELIPLMKVPWGYG